MIKSIKPLSLAEVGEILSAREETEKINEVKEYSKKFVKLKTGAIKNLKKDLEDLGILRLREEHLAKIIDVMPVDADDVRKIFAEISLDENEITKILEVTKKYL